MSHFQPTLTESFGGGGQATSKAPLSHAGGDDEALGSGSSTANFEPPVDVSCAATSSRALRERCRCRACRSAGSWTPRIPPPCSRGDAGTARSATCELTDPGASLQDVMLSIRVSAESHTHEVVAQPRQVRDSRSVTLPAVMRGGRTWRPRTARGSRLGRGGEDRVDLSHREGHALVLAYGDDLFHVGDRGKAGGHGHPGLGGRGGGEANLDGCGRQVVVRPSAVVGKPVFNLERAGRVDGDDSPPPVVL